MVLVDDRRSESSTRHRRPACNRHDYPRHLLFAAGCAENRDNIQVISIVGRFLEHSRIITENGGKPGVHGRTVPATWIAAWNYLSRQTRPKDLPAGRGARLNWPTTRVPGAPARRYVRVPPPQSREPVIDSQAWLLAHPPQGGTEAVCQDETRAARNDAEESRSTPDSFVSRSAKQRVRKSANLWDRAFNQVYRE
jgi:hypothetical protein